MPTGVDRLEYDVKLGLREERYDKRSGVSRDSINETTTALAQYGHHK